MKKRYGKLVRDGLPAKLRSEGKIVNARSMEREEFRRELLYLLIEKAEDLRKAGYDPSDKEALIAELADIEELIATIVAEFGLDPTRIAEVRDKKRETLGAFSERIFLESTIE